MNIIMLSDGFLDTLVERDKEFYDRVLPVVGKRVFFRGKTEAGPMLCGYLKALKGNTVEFCSEFDAQDLWVYPYWEVMLCEADLQPEPEGAQ